jgi:hypothetical protein
MHLLYLWVIVVGTKSLSYRHQDTALISQQQGTQGVQNFIDYTSKSQLVRQAAHSRF